MADRREVRCINKSNRTSAHERITHIGGKLSSGASWKLTQAQAIDGINNGTYSFFVKRGAKEAEVEVARSAAGHLYLRTKGDSELNNNLLSLDECS
jgi:hypothetical protein